MPSPTPLTQCEPPDLDWTRPGTPAARGFGDIYFSVEGGLEETRTVFLRACGLPKRWQGRRTFSIGELGFGSGLNFLAAWQLWDVNKPEGGHLHFISAEKYPFSADDLTRALSAWPEFETYAKRLIALWPGQVKGTHRLHVSEDVTLTLIHDDIDPALSGLSAQVDAWFLDGFSPSKNPAMWSPAVMQALGKLSAPGARVGTFTVAGAVRQALTSAGFEVSKKEGFGRKRHRLEAIYPGQIEAEREAISPIIIGGGIAGSSIARAFLRRGITPVLVDPNDDTAASANPAAIIKPRLDLQDRPESRFFLSSYLYALRAYAESDTIISRGVFHAAKDDKDMIRFEKLVANAPLPPAHLALGAGPYGTQGLSLPESLVIDPVQTCQNFSQGCKLALRRAVSISEDETGWWVVRMDDESWVTGSHVIFAAGAGVRDMPNFINLPLRYSRGQLTWADLTLEQNLTYGGYALPIGKSALLGATHKRLDERSPFEARTKDDMENLMAFEAISGMEAKQSIQASRSSVRVTTPSTLPCVDQVDLDAWAITGLGSRGFVFAPLLAEDLVSRLCGDPSALCQQTRARFQAREKPNQKARPL